MAGAPLQIFPRVSYSSASSDLVDFKVVMLLFESMPEDTQERYYLALYLNTSLATLKEYTEKSILE